MHRLTCNVLERPKAAGGLGMARLEVSYCQLNCLSQKDTNIWADYKETIEMFANEDGTPKKVCAIKSGGVCTNFAAHAKIRPDRSDESKEDRGAIYPNNLCLLLTLSGNSLLGKGARLRLDPATSGS